MVTQDKFIKMEAGSPEWKEEKCQPNYTPFYSPLCHSLITISISKNYGKRQWEWIMYSIWQIKVTPSIPHVEIYSYAPQIKLSVVFSVQLKKVAWYGLDARYNLFFSHIIKGKCWKVWPYGMSCFPHRMGSSDSSLSYWSRNVLARKKMTPEATNRNPATEAIAMPTTSGSDTYSSQCSPLYHQFSPTRHLKWRCKICQQCCKIIGSVIWYNDPK